MNTKNLIRNTKLVASTLDYILLDGSGSMADKWQETLSGLQSFRHSLETAGISSHCILHIFNSSNIEYLACDNKLNACPSFLSLSPPYGGTPLYDAINIMGRRLAELNPPSASIIIVTDGLETSSKVTTDSQARAILDWLRAKGYSITFLGADFNNSKQAQLLGADASNSLGIQRTKLTEAGALLGSKRVDNALRGTSINFSSEEKTDFGGYLTHST
jgi:hypothetical protein